MLLLSEEGLKMDSEDSGGLASVKGSETTEGEKGSVTGGTGDAGSEVNTGVVDPMDSEAHVS